MLNPYVLKAARKRLTDAGVEIGDLVSVRWFTTSAGGVRNEIDHTGVVSEIDDWMRIEGSDKTPGYLHLPLTGLMAVEVIPSDP